MEQYIRHRLCLAIYIMTIFYALHITIPYFVLAKFLNKYFSLDEISLVFIFSGIVTIIFTNYLSYFLKKYKDYKTLLTLCVLQILVSISLPFLGKINLPLLIFGFSVYMTGGIMIWSCISIFLEEFTPHDNTGAIRGLSMTIYYFGVLVSPFIAANILSSYGYTGLFILSGLMIIPIIFFTKEYLTHVKEPRYQHQNFWQTINKMKSNLDLQGVMISAFILNSFYAVINIYFVSYLLNEINISASNYLSVIVPISLLPFVLIPYWLGRISDEYLGEKKIIIFGILIFSLTLVAVYIFKIENISILGWAFILFIGRLGAAMCETGNYSYFYKKINVENTDLIAIFSTMINISSVFTALLGFIMIKIFNVSIPTIFFIIGLLGLISIFKILKIHDTITKSKLLKLKTETELSAK